MSSTPRANRLQAALAQAKADRDVADLNLSYTELRAPMDGIVGNRSARAGAYATIGAQMMSLVPARGLWVDANFKESQLARMRAGQPVTVDADVLPGPSLPRPRRQPRPRDRRGVQRAPRRERHRQLHQDRPARAGPHRPRRRRLPTRPAAPRPLGHRRGRHATAPSTEHASARRASTANQPRLHAQDRQRRHGSALTCIARPNTAAAAAPVASGGRPRHRALEGKKIFAFAVMCVGFFIALLDIQIVSASLSDIGGGLSAGADEIAWVQTSYLIAEIIVIPLSGWLSRVMSTRWLFCVSAAGSRSPACCAAGPGTSTA